MRKVEKAVSEKKDFTIYWILISIIGLLFFLSTSILGAEFKINFLADVSFLGLGIPASSLIIFQFNLFAGKSDLKLEFSDLKSFWFPFFNIFFFAMNAFVFSCINMVLPIVPGFKEADSMLSLDYFNTAWPYITIVYSSILVAGLIYRLAHHPKPYKMVIV